jgi:hypothetical protein
MRLKKKNLVTMTVLLCGLILFLSNGADAQVIAKKTLDRTIDQVTISGNIFKEVLGKPVDNLRVYASRNGAFEPIRYQIDEMTADGDWVLPEGPMPNSELGNGIFDTWDKLAFMIQDLGDKVSNDVWPSGYTKGEEIEVVDPLTGEKGWCYLLFFSSNPPPRSSLPDYIRFDYKTSRSVSDCRELKYLITDEGIHTTFYEDISIMEGAGGSGKNVLDRGKVRPTFKVLFGSLTIRLNEETVKSNILAWKIGPIKWNRRAEQYSKLPGGAKALRVIADVYEYRNMATAPVMFNVPFRFDTVVTSATVRFGSDYTKEVLGSRIYNSSNPKGFIVDGKMSDDEKNNFNPQFDEWRVTTGKFGTLITRTVLTKEIRKDITISMGFVDDITKNDPPERFPGTIGYLYQDWNIGHLKKGKYYLFLEFYYPYRYKPGDEMEYAKYLDHPVKIRSGSKEQENEALFLPNVGKKYL